jgi:transcriptional regulator with XRE-family HTH domain
MSEMQTSDDIKLRRHLKKFMPRRMAELGLTEAELARITGDGPNQIYRAVNGLNTPSATFFIRLKHALQCSFEELCGEAELVSS